MASLEAACLERTWFQFKDNDIFYYLNKTVSFLLASTLAFFTLRYREHVSEMTKLCPTEDYALIFWLLFIYYCFQALSELLEMYNSYMLIEDKGLLSLVFELNYLVGLYVTGKILMAVFRSPQCHETAPQMYNWLLFQTLLLAASVFVCLCVACCQGVIQKRVTRRRAKYDQ